MNVAISINGIFRDLLGKIQEVHQKYYESEIDGELTNKNVKKKLGFKTTKQYLKFLYEEAPMETFGHAKESENNSFIHLNNKLSEALTRHKTSLIFLFIVRNLKFIWDV